MVADAVLAKVVMVRKSDGLAKKSGQYQEALAAQFSRKTAAAREQKNCGKGRKKKRNLGQEEILMDEDQSSRAEACAVHFGNVLKWCRLSNVNHDPIGASGWISLLLLLPPYRVQI